MEHRLVLLCVGVACAALSGCRSRQPPPAPAPPAVVVAPPLVMRLSEWDEYTGRFEATDRVEVRARVNGYLDSIHFRDGTIVKPGDLLFVIDPRPYEAVLDGARADVRASVRFAASPWYPWRPRSSSRTPLSGARRHGSPSPATTSPIR